MALIDGPKEVEAFALAAIAGFLGYCMRTVQSGKRLRAFQATVETASAGLFGYLVEHLCEAMRIGHPWSAVVIGTFGWMGANVVGTVLRGFVFRKLGIKGGDWTWHGRQKGSSKANRQNSLD
jgi:hypothetical protein